MNLRKLSLLMLGGCLGALLGGYAVYFLRVMSSKPELRYINNGTFGKFVSENCPIVHETFSPTWWSGTSLLQTVTPTMFRSRLELLRSAREVINCTDGGTISLDWYDNAPSKETDDQEAKPIALMFPGLIGDSQSDYLRYIVPRLSKLGYRVASFNNRGRGGMELKTPRLYCAATYDDLELAVDLVRSQNPKSLIVATGFSMGGVVLTHYLADRGDQAKVDAAMLVSANFDLVNGTKAMETGMFNRLIARVMTKALVDVLESERPVLEKTDKPVQWDKLHDARSFRELDRYFTCPIWGYADPEDYYKDVTNYDRMPNIKVPTLALNSADDFFTPYETLPFDRLNEALMFVVTQRGGHLGFMDGWFPSMPYYGDKLIEQYYKALLTMKKDEPRAQLLKPKQD